MNPLPAPIVPGKTDAKRFDNALRKILSTPRSKKPLCPKPPAKSKPIPHVPLPFAEALKLKAPKEESARFNRRKRKKPEKHAER